MKSTIYQIHNRLFLSRIIGPADFDMVVEHRITAVVNLEPEHVFKPEPRLSYLFEGIPDWKPIPHETLARIYTFIENEIREGKVLVHCYSGRSRSGGVVAGWLMLENPEWTWETAVDFVRRVRDIRPAPGIKESIVEFVNTRRITH